MECCLLNLVIGSKKGFVMTGKYLFFMGISAICFSPLLEATTETLDTHLGPINISWVSDRYSGYNIKGEPLNVENINAQLPTTFLADIYAKIPDGRRVNPDFIDAESKSNLVIDDDFQGQVTVSVTFLNEGAYFRNTFGYFYTTQILLPKLSLT